MPIKPENRGRYPANWETLSLSIRFDRAAGRCECRGECGARPHDDGRCAALHGQPNPMTGSRVTLTVAHMDHALDNHDPKNLKAMCQRCHLAYDKEEHRAAAAKTREARTAPDAESLFDAPEGTSDAPTVVQATRARARREGM